MKVKVSVTQEDIDRGQRRDCQQCPVFLAVCRVIPSCVSVTNDAVWLGGYERHDRSPLPAEAMRFILSFDDGRPVEPFEFEVTP